MKTPLYDLTTSRTLEGAVELLRKYHDVRLLDLAYERKMDGDGFWVDLIVDTLTATFDECDYPNDERELTLNNIYCECGGRIFVCNSTYIENFTDDGDIEFESGYCFSELVY